MHTSAYCVGALQFARKRACQFSRLETSLRLSFSDSVRRGAVLSPEPAALRADPAPTRRRSRHSPAARLPESATLGFCLNTCPEREVFDLFGQPPSGPGGPWSPQGSPSLKTRETFCEETRRLLALLLFRVICIIAERNA